MDQKPRLTRLTSIITQLQTKRMITATELAVKYDVSVRTIYRDIRTLESSGIPICTEEGKGYSLLEGYQLPPVVFSEEEANALITAEQLILKNNDTSFRKSYSQAIDKIKAVLKYSQKEKVDLLSERLFFRADKGSENSSNYIMEIQTSITNFQLIEIIYQSKAGKTTNRIIEPFALYNNKGDWILIAFCRLRQDFRTFRVDFIQTLFSLPENFSPHNMTIQEFFEIYIKK